MENKPLNISGKKVRKSIDQRSSQSNQNVISISDLMEQLSVEPEFKTEINPFIIDKCIAKSLQGNVFLGRLLSNNKVCIIKTANKILYKNNITIVKGNIVSISEDFTKECKIMKALTVAHKNNNYKPKYGFPKLIKYYDDNNYYYSIQQYGGINFFQYITDQHKLIKNGKLSLKIWKIKCKKYFCQIINTINWIHSLGICHLDISLENMCLDTKNDYVNIIDFGLSEVFNVNKGFKCKKYCGKVGYHSIEMANKMIFDARKHDSWSIGVCLYMIWYGIPPYKRAVFEDPYFCNLWYGHTNTMLKAYDMQNFIDKDIHDILSKIFVYENKRFSIQNIMKHRFTNGFKFDYLK